MRYRKHLSLLFLLFVGIVYGQEKQKFQSLRDSLLSLLKEPVSDQRRADIYLDLTMFNSRSETKNWEYWISKVQ
ncbi:MAG: hypothetical protein AAF039_18700, partial [Bacteroidota bacterium]